MVLTNHHNPRSLTDSHLDVKDCKKIPVKVCREQSCSVRPGEEVCHDEVSWREGGVTLLTERVFRWWREK